MTPVEVDVCVLGGGPSGSVAAIQLARLGLEVCIVERRDSARLPLAEALPESTFSLLAALGIRPPVEQLGLLRCDRARVRWGASEDERPGSTLLVDRGRFDWALLQAAHMSGVLVLAPARSNPPRYQDNCWELRVETGEQSFGVSARYLVEATGRRAEQTRLGPKTVALCGRWRRATLPDAPETRIEAQSDSWLWAAPLLDGSYAATVFLDTARCAGLSRAARRQLYRKLVTEGSLARLLERAELVGDVKVRDATCQIAPRLVTTRSIRVGDSALAMDPLSSQGVQAGIRTGTQASIVINTALGGGDQGAALDFYRRSVERDARRHCRLTASIYGSQGKHESDFWRERARHGVPEQPVGNATAAIGPATRLVLSPAASLEELPVIDGETIRRKPSLSRPDLDFEITWFAGTEVAPLLAGLEGDCSPSMLLSRWSRVLPENAARSLLELLISQGVLIPADQLERYGRVQLA